MRDAPDTFDPAGARERAPLRWTIDVPLLTDPVVQRDLILMSGTIALISAGFFATAFGLGAGAAGIMVGALLGGAVGILAFVITVAVMVHALGNRCPLEFSVEEDGVRLRRHEPVPAPGTTVRISPMLLHAMFGGHELTTTGAFRDTPRVVGTLWDDVHLVSRDPDQAILGIRGSAFRVMRVYCTRDNYAAVAQRVVTLVEGHAPNAVIR